MNGHVAQPTSTLHEDSDTFDRSSFPYEELYGKNWNGMVFKPLFRNIGTGDRHASPHHAKGGGARSRDHFDLTSSKCYYAFCLQWHTVRRYEQLVRTRCLEVFLIDSGGCQKKGHQNSILKDAGPNSIFRKLLKGQTISWDILKDPDEEEDTEDSGDKPEDVGRQAIFAERRAMLDAKAKQNGKALPKPLIRAKAMSNYAKEHDETGKAKRKGSEK